MYEKEINEVKENYKKWLLSGWEDNANAEKTDIFEDLKKNLLEYRCGEFEININNEAGHNLIDLGYRNNANYEKVGQTIIYRKNSYEKYDVALLLLYIAERLDEADRNASAFQQRGNRYFFRKTKEFINERIIPNNI